MLLPGVKSLREAMLVKIGLKKVYVITQNKINHQLLKRKKRNAPSSDANHQCGKLSCRSSAAPHAASLLPKHMTSLNTYWDSTEANKVFRPRNDENNALEAVHNQMELLLLCVRVSKGYW
jgi:hypothetical protein